MKELATWPVRKNLGIFHLLVTEHSAEKKPTKKCVTGSKFHCKLEWIFVEEDRREGVVQFVLGIVFLD